MKKRYVLLAILAIAFIVITTLVVTKNTTTFDNSIYNFIYSLRNNTLDTYFINITKCANTMTIVIIVCILLMLIKDKARYILGTTTIFTVLINQMIKNIIDRPRPDHLRLIKEGGYSYPSGHSMISIAVYGFLIYYVYKKVKNKYLKVTLITLLVLLILSIGASRIYLGVHYPSDVLGGYILSLIILITTTTIINKHIRGK